MTVAIALLCGLCIMYILDFLARPCTLTYINAIKFYKAIFLLDTSSFATSPMRAQMRSGKDYNQPKKFIKLP